MAGQSSDILGSSPHTRGAPAGLPPYTARGGDHPRIRGEHQAHIGARGLHGSDHPRIRGEHTLCNYRLDVNAGIIPAYAGSTDWRRFAPRVPGGSSPHTRGAQSQHANSRLTVGDHPRIRGEHHTVGECGAVCAGIIPAYAGSTTEVPSFLSVATGSSPHTRGARGTRTRWRCPLRDHPRIRGEHT